MELSGILYTASTWAIPILVAITFHEAAHAYAAWKLGDDTAFRLGRVTFNPLKHVDPFGTVLVPTLLLLFKAPFLFGWATPVPRACGTVSAYRPSAGALPSTWCRSGSGMPSSPRPLSTRMLSARRNRASQPGYGNGAAQKGSFMSASGSPA